MDLSQFHWLNPPKVFERTAGTLTLNTDPNTDFWQRTYYGFRNDNAHAFLLPVENTEFSFSVRVAWKPEKLYDQCGVVIYHDPDNWFKASVELENKTVGRLGSVVTNLGYSDWATTDIDAAIQTMVYRLSRRGPDFYIENSYDGRVFQQMRMFHMHAPLETVNLGVYACSPLKSSFQSEFSDFSLGGCVWELHQNPE